MSASTIPSTTLPPVDLVKQPPKGSTIVVGLVGGDQPRLIGLPDDVEKAWSRTGANVLQQAQDLGASSKPECVVLLPKVGEHRLVVVGAGDQTDVSPEQLRRCAGRALCVLNGLRSDHPAEVVISLEAVSTEAIEAVVVGALLGAYRFAPITAEAARASIPAIHVLSSTTGAPGRRAVDAGLVVARAVCAARDWVNTPANLLFPDSFAQLAGQHARDAGISVEVLDERALQKGGYGGILAVGGGSANKPRLVRLEYRPRGAKAHLALVGKGITFDSGGLDLKTQEGMYTMKVDMAGAAAVLTATRAIAELGLPVRVTCYAAMAENMPSGNAYRPSDVLTMYSGTTVENANTDAEGRLVLADALARADQDNPDLIVDVATLTGACIVALGDRIAGLMACDDATADRVLDAAEAAGEQLWQLPIPDHIREHLKSDVADLKSGGARNGGAMVAAAFLQRFVGDDRAWAHLDIAGPAIHAKEPYGYVPKGGTGFAVRTLVELARGMC